MIIIVSFLVILVIEIDVECIVTGPCKSVSDDIDSTESIFDFIRNLIKINLS